MIKEYLHKYSLIMMNELFAVKYSLKIFLKCHKISLIDQMRYHAAGVTGLTQDVRKIGARKEVV